MFDLVTLYVLLLFLYVADALVLKLFAMRQRGG